VIEPDDFCCDFMEMICHDRIRMAKASFVVGSYDSCQPLQGKRDISCDSGCCPATFGFAWAFYLFGFFKDADSNVAPPSYLGTALGTSNQTVICRMVWDDESIDAALRTSERGVRHGACRPF